MDEEDKGFQTFKLYPGRDDDPTGETTIFPLTLAGQESSAVPRFSPSAPVSHEASEVGTDLVAPAEFWWFWGRDV